MRKFLAVFTGTPENMEKWMALSEAKRNENERKGKEAWKNWATTNSARIKDMGGPLGETKRVDSTGIHDTRNSMAAYTIVEASSHGEAAKLFVKHPHFSIFPGDGVEIMEVLAIPVMK